MQTRKYAEQSKEYVVLHDTTVEIQRQFGGMLLYEELPYKCVPKVMDLQESTERFSSAWDCRER